MNKKLNMKNSHVVLLLLALAAGCKPGATGSKLDKDKAKLADLKKQDVDLREKIQILEDSVKAEGGKEVKTTKVGLQALTAQSFKHYVEVQASVYGQDNINVNPEMPGVVKTILVTEGDRVSKGQVLATIDDAVLQQNIQEIQTNLDLAKTLYEKQKGLWDQKIGTEVQYLSAKSNYEALQKRLASVQQQDDMTRIKSPIDGVIDAVKIRVGESVAPGLPTIQVVNTDQLKVRGYVDEAYVADIHKGDSMTVRFPDLNKDILSVASYVSRNIDPVNRTFTVEVKLPQGTDYHPNMIAMMKIIDYTNATAMVIPINVVQSDPTGSFVFVAVDQNGAMVAKKTIVTVGKVYGGMAEITAGLKAGDKVITLGYDNLNNGDAISL
jgi:membrane fusion protein, multidrug efflux system